VFLITGGHDVDIDGEPTAAEWTLLVLIALAPPLIVGVGWLVSRLSNSRIRSVIAIIGVTIAAVVVVFEAGVAQLPQIAIVVAAILLLTASGLGSVLGWAVRMVLSHLATVGALAVRALPVVLLTAIVFFHGYVWLMSTTITGDRLGLAMAFLIAIAAAFVVSATREWIRPTLQSTTALLKDSEQLADTPFATMPDARTCAPLKRAERLNVVFVLAASQLAQILVVAVVTSTIYLVLGLIVLTPALLNEWTHTYSSTATVLGWKLPVPDSLIHICLFLGALTFMYISARAAGDAEYRSTFLDPLTDDRNTTLIARNRYRGAIAGAV
jgi:hypothetical protein